MKCLSQLFVWLVLILACGGCGPVNTDATPAPLTTIRYTDDAAAPFQISGSELKAHSLPQLKLLLVEHQRSHAGSQYELLAELKNSGDREREIIEIFHSAGVVLRHYWAPVSDISLQPEPGKYGSGHVDVLDASGSLDSQ